VAKKPVGNQDEVADALMVALLLTRACIKYALMLNLQ